MKLMQFLSAVLISSLISLVTLAQSQVPPQAPVKSQPESTEKESEGVFRVNTQLVQIDAVVTDKKNAHIEDLKESDFEIFVDGKKQSLTYFRLVKLALPTLPVLVETKRTGITTTVPPPGLRQLAPEQVHRTIALVVDDLGLSFGSIDAVRDALRKFVNTQMQENDLVGIIQTGKGLGSLQQFTSDKRILNIAIDKLRWNPFSRDMLPSFGAQVGDPVNASTDPSKAAAFEKREGVRKALSERNDDFRDTVFSVGTLGAVNFVVRGLRELPGRKMVILLSDGFRLFGRDHNNSQALENLRRLTDLANRASVVLYTIDARGIVVVMPTAADDARALSPQAAMEAERKQMQLFSDSQDGLRAFAENTGGFAVLNNNDLNLGLQRVMQDNQSYYLLGFDPDDEQFNVKYQDKFHAIKIKVNRPGLAVRTRSGYFGVTEALARETPKTGEQQIINAIFSPFGARDLSVQMTSLFFNPQPGKSFVRSYLHVDPDKLKFVDLPTGEKELTLDVATFTFDENGKAIEHSGKWYSLRLNKTQYEAALKKGISYEHDTPIQKPGAYQFRVVIRDVGSEKLGSAGQFITVPNLEKNQLALSGLTLLGSQTPTSEEAKSESAQPNNAARRFNRNARLEYWLFIYNAQLEKETQKPKLSVQSEIYQDGKVIFQSSFQELPSTGQTDLKRIVCGGEVNINNLPRGEYLLHVIVKDPVAKAKYAESDQWMDFSIQ